MLKDKLKEIIFPPPLTKGQCKGSKVSVITPVINHLFKQPVL